MCEDYHFDLKDLSAEKPEVKYTCAKEAIALSKENPAELYPNIELFIDLLDSENQVMKWTAIQVVGNLARVDKEGKVDRLLEKLIKFLDSGKMITANNAILALSEIAVAKPEHQSRITNELLKVENYTYDTDECRNIALGKVILAIDSYFDRLEDTKAVLEFAERQTKNSRNATRKKAGKFLNKFKR